jgi:hypothetical protein
MGTAAVVVIGAVEVAWVVVVCSGVVNSFIFAAGAEQAARREINDSIRTKVKMGLNQVPEPFRPSVILFLAIFLTLLLISSGSDLAIFL